MYVRLEEMYAYIDARERCVYLVDISTIGVILVGMICRRHCRGARRELGPNTGALAWHMLVGDDGLSHVDSKGDSKTESFHRL